MVAKKRKSATKAKAAAKKKSRAKKSGARPAKRTAKSKAKTKAKARAKPASKARAKTTSKTKPKAPAKTKPKTPAAPSPKPPVTPSKPPVSAPSPATPARPAAPVAPAVPAAANPQTGAPSGFEVLGTNDKALFTLKLHRGDGMTLIGMNWKNGRPPDNFVGFAIEYQEPGAAQFFALNNRLNFLDAAGNVNPNQLPTLQSPIQKFRWVHFPRNAELAGPFTYRVTQCHGL